MNHLKKPMALCVHLVPKDVEKIIVLTMTRCDEVLCCALVGSSQFLTI